MGSCSVEPAASRHARGRSLTDERQVLDAVTQGCRDRLRAHYGRTIDSWLDRVPELMADAAHQWDLRLVSYHDAGHASTLALATTTTGEPVMLKAWFDPERHRHETAALRHWEPANGRVLRAVDYLKAVACLTLVGGVPGGEPRPTGEDAAIAQGLRRLHELPLPRADFPTFDKYLHETVRPRMHRRIERFGSDVPTYCLDIGLKAEPSPTRCAPVLLHGDLYRENVPFEDGRPVFLDALPMIGDPAADWAFFTVYFDVEGDAIHRLHTASTVSRVGVDALLPWCLRLCLDGLLYYHDVQDPREERMAKVMAALAAEGSGLS